MRFFFLLFTFLFITRIVFSQNLFETNDHILKFESNNITLDKEKKINEIKKNSFQKILNNILTKEDFKKLNSNNISFINKFILNLKIINNNYYSIVTVNYNRDLIINYLINNKISFVDYLPEKFLIIILEQNSIKNNLLSKDNNFYIYLNDEDNILIKNLFKIPSLDYNDRYLFNINNFLKNNYDQNNKLNIKYKTDYQILVHSILKDNYFNNQVFLFYDNNKKLILNNKTKKLNYEIFFNLVANYSMDAWKNFNKIDTSIISKINCKIDINNIYELKYVRSILKKNNTVKNFNLKTIKFNNNTYQISFFGNLDIFTHSLERDRLKLFVNDNSCSIKLI